MLAKSWLVRFPIGIPRTLSLSRRYGVITPDDLPQEALGARIGHAVEEQLKQNLMINRVKELGDVTLERPARTREVLTHAPDERLESPNRCMCTSPNSTRVRIVDEGWVKDRVEYSVDRVMDDPIPNLGFVDVAEFGIGDIESRILAVAIRTVAQVAMERKQLRLKGPLKPADVQTVAFATPELLPTGNEILKADECFKEGVMHTEVPLFQKIYDFYKAYFQIADHLPRKSRDVLGRKIEENVIEVLQLVTNAAYLGTAQKLECLKRASSRIDFLKVLFRLCYEVKIIDQKKYIRMEEKLDEMGRMLGGWLKTTSRSLDGTAR